MTLELRVLSGARQGAVVRADQPTVLLGRHATCDLRLDPATDLDVSARHAEIRRAEGRWSVRDAGSTNGTYVNGERLAQERELRDGDVLSLGAAGPRVEVRLRRLAGANRQGIAIAAGLAVVAVALSAVLVVRGRSRGAAHAEQAGTPTTSTAPTTMATSDAAPSHDFRAAARASGPAVAYLVTTLGGRPYGGTAFAVTPTGLLVTNRHLVEDRGVRATRVLVKFSDTNRFLRARVVRTAPATGDDLALLQVEDAGPFPIVAGIRARVGDLGPGTPVSSIGFPLPDEIPTDSVGGMAVARSSLVTGVVSKALDRLLQIESFATHGASGSPVLDETGRVVGVVYGGARGSNGRLVYAVPADRLVALLGTDGGAVVGR